MSNLLLAAARKTDVRGPSRAVLMVLADRANESGVCWPGKKTIANESGVAFSTVKKHLKLLKESGLISISSRSSDGGDSESNLYTLHLPDNPGGSPDNPGGSPDNPGGSPDNPGGSPDNPGGSPDNPGVGHQIARGGSPRGPKASYKHKEKPHSDLIIDSAESMDTEPAPARSFLSIEETIYQAYPRKTGRATALKAIKKALKTSSPSFLLERTQTYAAAIGWQDRQFIPHPATWFNAERFHDDPSEWSQPSISNPSTQRKLTSSHEFI